jgi:hypothetical protein
MRPVVGHDVKKAVAQTTRGCHNGETDSQFRASRFRQAVCFAVHFLVREALANLPEM